MAAARKKLAAKHKSLRRQARTTLRRAASEPTWKTLKKPSAKANLAKVLVAAELLDLAHRRIVARKVYQLAHLIWNVPYMGGGIKLETMLKTLHDLTQIFYSEMMATQAKMTSGAFLDEAAIRYINTEDVKARLCGLVVAIENLFFQGKMPRRGRSEIKDMLLNFICGQLSEEEREIAREEIEADPKRIAGE